MGIDKGGVIINNPYSRIMYLIKQQNNTSSSAVEIGKVSSTNPLSISIGELFLDREDLMVNESVKSFKFQERGLTPPSLEGIRF